MPKKRFWEYGDLINGYIAQKIKSGYEPRCTKEELIKLLDFMSYFLKYYNPTTKYELVLEEYISGMGSKDKVWNIAKGNFDYPALVIRTKKGFYLPTYNLKESIESEEIKELFAKFLEHNCSKRRLNETIQVDEETSLFGYRCASAIILYLWEKKIHKYMESGFWPEQCRDINRFMLEMDLASVIKLPSLKEELLSLYHTISKNIMLLSQDNPNFQMSNQDSALLAKSNFDLAMGGKPYFQRISNCDEIVSIDRRTQEFKVTVGDNSQVTNLNSPEVLELIDEIAKEATTDFEYVSTRSRKINN